VTGVQTCALPILSDEQRDPHPTHRILLESPQNQTSQAHHPGTKPRVKVSQHHLKIPRSEVYPLQPTSHLQAATDYLSSHGHSLAAKHKRKYQSIKSK